MSAATTPSSSSNRTSDGASSSSSSSSTALPPDTPAAPFSYFRTPADFSAYVRSLSGRQLAAAGAAAVATPLLVGAAWWLAEKSFNTMTPYQYHYRPGTISAFFSRALARHASRRRSRAPVRVYMDGCFDMMHYGHANALRQAKALGDVLVVGLIPDSQIRMYKGPPVMNDAERKAMVESLKWVDEVLTDVPYELTPDFLHELFTRHRIDVVVHGDDPCLLPDGTDAYAHAKAQGRFRVIKRTEGVSSTDIVGRMLMRTPPENKSASFSSKGGGKKKGDLYPAEALAKQFSAGDPEALAMLGSSPPSTSTGAVAVAEAAAAAAAAAADAEKRRRKAAAASGGAAAPAAGDEEGEEMDGATEESALSPDAAAASEEPTTASASAPTPRGAPPTAVSRFLPTTRRIVQFSAGAAAARPGDRVVYLDGAFDLFHPGHVAALKAARALGDFLLVGVHSDEDVRARRGVGRPIMDLHERALSVLACRFVNEVVIGAPAVLTEDLLTTFNVAVVARGTTTETTLALSPSPSCSSSSPLDFAFSSGGRRQLGNGGGGGFSRGGGLPSMTSLSAPPSRAPSPSPVPSGVLEALGAPASPRGGGGGGDGDGDGDGKEGASSSAADAATADDASAAAPSATEAAAVAAAAAAEVAAAASFSSSSADASNGGGSNNNHGGSFFLSDERRYAVARAKGIFREFRSPSTLTAAAVVDRIVAHRAQFERRNAKKAAAEAAYYRESKTYVAEK